MSIDQSCAKTDKSPVHVHVDEKTPVYVHVKKPPRKSWTPIKNSTMEMKSKPSAASFGESNLRKSTVNTASKSRSKSPTRSKSPGPWVPPPGRTSKANKYSWQGPSHRLEISAPDPETLHLSDLNTDDEDAVNNKMRNYERKIGTLMSEVGSLRNEVDLARSMRELERKDEILETSRQALEEQEHELEDYRNELEISEIQNKILRERMLKLHDQADLNTSQTERLLSVNDPLVRKLVEVEVSGQAAAKQGASLRDLLRRLRDDKRLSLTDSGHYSKQKDLFLERLADFEVTNRSLRRLLRDRHDIELDSFHLREQRDLLLQKLSETEDSLQHYRSKCYEKDQTESDLRGRLESQKEETLALSGLQSSLENTRGHLQKQLRQKEADCNRMAVQIRSLESQLAQEKIEMDHVRQLLSAAKQKADKDKEALKKATRVQKQRASRSEDAVDQLNAQLMERETLLTDLGADVDGLKARCDKLIQEKVQAETEGNRLKKRLIELETLLEQVELDSKQQAELDALKMADKTSESNALKLDNDRMKVEHLNLNLEMARENYHKARDEGQSLQTKVDSIERKLSDVEAQNKELLNNLAKREDSIHQTNLQLEEKSKEAGMLARQLDSTLAEARRQADESRDKIVSKDRSLHSRILDLETQLSQARAEVARVKREKDEAERKFNSRLYDLKDRLDQSHSTNRSMQNYVHFLKNSYANVFGDTSLTASPSPLRSTLH